MLRFEGGKCFGIVSVAIDCLNAAVSQTIISNPISLRVWRVLTRLSFAEIDHLRRAFIHQTGVDDFNGVQWNAVEIGHATLKLILDLVKIGGVLATVVACIYSHRKIDLLHCIDDMDSMKLE